MPLSLRIGRGVWVRVSWRGPSTHDVGGGWGEDSKRVWRVSAEPRCRRGERAAGKLPKYRPGVKTRPPSPGPRGEGGRGVRARAGEVGRGSKGLRRAK